MQVEIVPLLKDNFAYVVHDGKTGAVIDPSEARPVIKALNAQGVTLDLILCTHHHPDHVGGAKELSRYFQCPIWASKWDLKRIEGSSKGLTEENEITVAGEPVRILHVPGHTAGQVSFYFYRSGALFTGDTLFSLGCGRLFEGTPEEMLQSLKKIAGLPDDTKIYFGHEYTLRNGAFARKIEDSPELDQYLLQVEEKLRQGGHSTPTTLGLEKRLNPFMNTDSIKEWTKRRSLRNDF